MMDSKLTYRDLDVWKKGHQLVLHIYKITENFPKSEQFGLTDQMRRASISITSNIAEGFARRNKGEKAQFYYMALGSLTELSNQIEIANDLNYISQNTYNEIFQQMNEVERLIRSLIRSTLSKQR